MKRVSTLLKISFVMLVFCLLAGVVPSPLSKVSADAGCKDTICTRSYPWQEYSCPNSQCSGCYKRNGEEGGGRCSNGGDEND